jgi:hypothetical protein
LQPQIITPSLLLETLQRSVAAFPKDTMAPIVIDKDSASVISKICGVHIFVKNGIMGYIISLPLISRDMFKTFKLISLLGL